MKANRFASLVVSALVLASTVTPLVGQKKNPPAKPPKPIIFAVLNDGQSLEPIAYINGKRLENPVGGDSDQGIINAFSKVYYKTGATYRFVFGGAGAGNVTVKKSYATADCSKNTGEIAVKSPKVILKGFVMGLATNAAIKNKAASVRRRPTTAERSEIEALVKKEFAKKKLTPSVLKSQNLTAIDVNNDGKVELVGSYWVDVDKFTRDLLFFIADKGANGKYTFGHVAYSRVEQKDVMSQEIKDVDDGIYHEVLLDSFDFDGDGVNEIFTTQPSFEGAGFTAYQRKGNKWVNIFENANYHCAY
ncbi:MAG: hypothetical protein IPG67_18740 [Acidobacteria bacterium]|nr:hypothetical protein [Acidobacteriota bacterium]